MKGRSKGFHEPRPFFPFDPFLPSLVRLSRSHLFLQFFSPLSLSLSLSLSVFLALCQAENFRSNERSMNDTPCPANFFFFFFFINNLQAIEKE